MYDTVIIGSGPAGLAAAIYAQRAQLRAIVVEKEYLGTGQIAQADCVDNYPGMIGKNGYDLGETFRNHAESLGASFLEDEVTGLKKTECGWQIMLSAVETLETKTVIYAAGASHRKLGIPGEIELAGSGVSYCAVCDGAFYSEKTVAVIGGGDTALGEAIHLSHIAKKVYLIHRRDKFRANATLQNQVRKIDTIEPVLCAVPIEISGTPRVERITIQQKEEERILAVNGVFVAVGSVPNAAVLHGVAELDSHGYVVADESGVSSAEGLFVAGDVRTKQLRQVITAASDGANCIDSVQRYLQV